MYVWPFLLPLSTANDLEQKESCSIHWVWNRVWTWKDFDIHLSGAEFMKSGPKKEYMLVLARIAIDDPKNNPKNSFQAQISALNFSLLIRDLMTEERPMWHICFVAKEPGICATCFRNGEQTYRKNITIFPPSKKQLKLRRTATLDSAV